MITSRYFEMKRTFVELDNVMYEVIRSFHETPDLDVDEWKDYLMCDKLFRKNEILYFCRTIEEATILD